MSNDLHDEVKDETVERVRPLTATAARNLSKLIDNDFNAMTAEMRLLANDEQERRVKEVEETFAATEAVVRQFEDRFADLMKDFRNGIESLRREARDADLRVGVETYYLDRIEMNFSMVEKERAVAKVRAEVTSALNTALVAAERSRLDAQRKVLIASVTSDAEALLSSIPSAKDLMIQAAEQRNARQQAIQA